MISDITNNFNAPVRNISAKVELYEGSALADVYTQYYALKEFTIERVGESKFFGFGVCQKLNIHLIDKDRQIYITTADSFKVYLSVNGGEYVNPFPTFYVTEVHRDENTNELSITAYDAIYKASAHTIAELPIEAPYTLDALGLEVALYLGLGFGTAFVKDFSFDTEYDNGGNFDGTETLREVLNAIAEATQTIYYIRNNQLLFHRLDKDGNSVFTIDKNNYFVLDSGENRRLSKIVHATELGDNVSATTGLTGTTQYIRDNPFWDLRDDIGTLVDNALAAIGGLTINQFECEWRGNPLLEICDKISLTTKDNETFISYVLDDVISYDGTLSQVTRWEYEDNEEESADNPSTIGDALKQTYARVDKANKQIDLVASETGANSEAISALQINTDTISASVTNVEQTTAEALEGVNGNIATLTEKVEATVTATDVNLMIESSLENGVDKVTTSTGFTFNEEGLTISKSNSEIQTTITEDGMYISKNDEEVLTANNEGVKAEDLHATTYLIIGNYSRFEDYGDRTGCFWIGG